MGDFILNSLNSLPDIFWDILKISGITTLMLIQCALYLVVLRVMYFCLGLPLRRAERARVFLDLLESTLKQGRPLEENFVSLAQSRDLSMGVKFHVFCAWLETGLSFPEALARVPAFLPAPVVAMLRAGQQTGDTTKVLPACRQLLQDASSRVQGAFHYLVLLTFLLSPFGFLIFAYALVSALPLYLEIAGGLNFALPPGMLWASFLWHYRLEVILMGAFLMLLFWMAAFVYIGGSRVTAWFPVLENVYYRLPWRRRRMQRDFSTMLALLLDAGLPEAEALILAADCSANSIFRRRAAGAVDALRQGLALPEAVHRLDDSGEFRWRLRNAAAGPGGFLRALAGWHESLNARAFQQEQAAAHVITTAVVLWCGLFVGVICVSVFMFLTSIINTGVLW